MFNDIMWSAVNGVTNYNQLFGISNLAAGWILAGFLFVDVSVILWRRHLEHTEFLTKRSQYIQERDDIERGGDLDRYAILTEQIHQLDLTWQANDAKYWFDASAAFLLASGFTASMIVSLPVLFIGSYVVCTFAVGMYLSDDAYRNYKEKSLILDEVHLHSKMDPSQAIQDYQNARNEFAFTLAKNTIIPMFLIGTFTLCWQAALLLTIAYAGYSLYRSYPGSAKDEALVYDGPQNALASPA